MPNVWPSGLPALPFFGYKISRRPNVIANETADGPPEVRRRSTRAREVHTTAIELTGAQKDIFDAFFIDTLADGVLDFEHTDLGFNGTPRTAVYNLLGNYPTEFQQVTQAPLASKRLYHATLILEYKGLAS